MSEVVSVLLCLLPVALLIVMMVIPRGVPSQIALPSMALLLYLIKLVYHEASPSLIHATILEGILTSFTPICIIWGAVLLFKTMESCDSMRIIKAWLHGISKNRVAQLMIVGWAFAFLIEGASGFGTPPALAGPLLVGMGFPADRIVVLCLIMNTCPVIFGAVGMPTWFGLGQLGLTEEQLQVVARKSATINTVIGLVIPVIALRFVVSSEEILHNIPFVYGSLLCSLGPFLILAMFNYEFPTIIGGIVGLLGSVLLAKYNIGLDKFPNLKVPEINIHWKFWQTDKSEWMLPTVEMPSLSAMADQVSCSNLENAGLPKKTEKTVEPSEIKVDREKPQDNGKHRRHRDVLLEISDGEESNGEDDDEEEDSRSEHFKVPQTFEQIGYLQLLKAGFPLWGTALVLLITRVDKFKLKGLLTTEEHSGEIQLGTLGIFKISPAIVIQLVEIFQTQVSWRHQVLYVPSIIPFLLVSCITFGLYRMEKNVIKDIFKQAFKRILKPLIVLFGTLVLVRLFMVGGEDSCSSTLGRTVGTGFGAAWEYFGFFLGALGAFFSGSNTVTNLMFGPIQYTIAESEGINLTTMLALQSCGGAIGNMIAISNIIAASTVLGISGNEGWVMKRTIIPVMVAGIIAMIMAAIL